VGLVASVILGAETPINVWKDRFLFKVYCTEDAAAYFKSLLLMVKVEKKTGLSVLSTFLIKTHWKRDFSQAIYPFMLPYFCFNN